MTEVKEVTIPKYLVEFNELHNRTTKTYEKVKGLLGHDQRKDWERTISSLDIVCKSLSKGLKPSIPPTNWGSSQLQFYLGNKPPIIEETLKDILSLFPREQLLVYDPTDDKFKRPRKCYPLMFSFVDLSSERIHFLIGEWDKGMELQSVVSTRGINKKIESSIERIKQLLDWFDLNMENEELKQPYDFTKLKARRWYLSMLPKVASDAYSKSKWGAAFE